MVWFVNIIFILLLTLCFNVNIKASCYNVDNFYIGMYAEQVEIISKNKIKIKRQGLDFHSFNNINFYFFLGQLWRMEVLKEITLYCKEKNNYNNIKILFFTNKITITDIIIWKIIKDWEEPKYKNKIRSKK